MQLVKQRMPLPPRQEFDLEGAADYLGCSAEEFSLHLHLGDVRLAITTDGLDYDFAAPLKDLPLRVQKEITGVLADGEFVDILNPPTLDSSPATSLKPNYLYLSREARQLLVGSSNGQVIQEFQALDGQQVTIWRNGELGSAVLKRLFLLANDDWISDTEITKEELDRFLGKATPDSSEPKPAYAVPPQKPTEEAIMIVEYANQFYWERGEHPKLKEFARYLDLHAAKDGFRKRSKEEMDAGKTAHEKAEYDFNGYGLKPRQLSYRLRIYKV